MPNDLNCCCIIPVGGVDHRLAGSVPRALQPICGVPVTGHVVRAVESLGVDHITVVSNAEGLGKYLGDRAAHIQREGSRGSGDALFMAKSRIEEFQGDVLVVYGDRPMIRPETLRKMVEAGRKAGVDCAFLTVVMHDPYGHARIVRSADGDVERTGRDCEIHPELQKVREVIAGAYYFRKEALLKAFEELKPEETIQFYVTDLTTYFAEKKQVLTIQVSDADEVRGVYSFKDLADAEAIMQRRIMDRWMEHGVRIVDPRTTSISAEAKIGRDSIIYSNTVIEGPCEIGRGCSIGPFARIRPNVELGDGVAIGNFVEVVRSKIADRTRIKHLSFIGDAQVGTDVVIGAGTITANFDGSTVHPTVIEDEATIGSGTVLIAPVNVGSRAMTGSGSVVTRNHDVPSGEMVAGVPAKPMRKQKSKTIKLQAVSEEPVPVC